MATSLKNRGGKLAWQILSFVKICGSTGELSILSSLFYVCGNAGVVSMLDNSLSDVKVCNSSGEVSVLGNSAWCKNVLDNIFVWI